MLAAAQARLSAELDREELAAALERVKPMVQRGSKGDMTKLGLRLRAGGVELVMRGSAGMITEVVAAEYDGPDLALRVMPTHLTDAVKATGGERIRIGLPSAAADPQQHRMITVARVGETGYLHLVMLMRYAGDALDPWVQPRGRLRGAA